LYDFEIGRVVAWIREEKAESILVQAPDGIKPYLSPLLEALEESGVKPLLSGSHAWGGCDVAVGEARILGVRHIVHLGHHGPVRFRVPKDVKVLFVPCRSLVCRVPLDNLISTLESVQARNVGVVGTVQHAHQLNELARKLINAGFAASVGRSEHLPEGVVLGCDYSAALSLEDADAYVVLAGGLFHALGLAIVTDKPVVSVDPFTGRVEVIDERTRRRILSRRLSDLSRALDAKEIAIVVSVKPGQLMLRAAERAQRELRARGYRTRVIVLNDITRDALLNAGLADAYLNTACPRLVTDDLGVFPGPAVNIGELEYLTGRSLSEYRLRDSLSPRAKACAKGRL